MPDVATMGFSRSSSLKSTVGTEPVLGRRQGLFRLAPPSSQASSSCGRARQPSRRCPPLVGPGSSHPSLRGNRSEWVPLEDPHPTSWSGGLTGQRLSPDPRRVTGFPGFVGYFVGFSVAEAGMKPDSIVEDFDIPYGQGFCGSSGANGGAYTGTSSCTKPRPTTPRRRESLRAADRPPGRGSVVGDPITR